MEMPLKLVLCNNKLLTKLLGAFWFCQNSKKNQDVKDRWAVFQLLSEALKYSL